MVPVPDRRRSRTEILEPRDTAIFCFVKYVLFDAIVKNNPILANQKCGAALNFLGFCTGGRSAALLKRKSTCRSTSVALQQAQAVHCAQIWGFGYHSIQLQYSTQYPVELYLILVVFRYPVQDLHNSNLHSKFPPPHIWPGPGCPKLQIKVRRPKPHNVPKLVLPKCTVRKSEACHSPI